MITVLKLGGELLDEGAAIQSAAQAVIRLSSRGSLVIVHGGGRAIDEELRARGLAPRFADGLRVTDRPTLEAVVSVLAGWTNTALVAAIVSAGGRAIGVTGADGSIGLSTRMAPFTTVSGESVDLGLVGEPVATDVSLLTDLLQIGSIPVMASIGVTADGALLNVNADTFAAHLAIVLPASRLIVAGSTAGVLDSGGRTIPALSVEAVDAMIASGDAHSGMIAKLTACRRALTHGVRDISIVSGRSISDFDRAPGTTIYRELVTT